MSRTILAALIAAVCATFFPTKTPASPEPPDAAGSIVRVSLTDGAAAADARVLLYKHNYRDRGEVIARQTAQQGECEFSSLTAGNYLVVARTKTHMAGRDLFIENDQEVPVVLHLKPAVQSHVIVLDPEGNALANAELQSLKIQDESGAYRLTPRQAARVGLAYLPSDANGKLQLPSLPEGVQLELAVSHPDYPQVAASGLKSNSGLLERLRFEPGVALQLSFEAVGDVQLPEEIRLYLLPAAGSNGTDLRSVPFPLDARGRTSVMVKPGSYSLFQFDLSQDEDYSISPFGTNEIEVSATQPWRLSCRVHRKIEVAGRVLDAQGEPVAEASVHGEVALPPGTDKTWSHIAWAETDADGNYTVRVAPGASRVSVEARGFTHKVQEIDAVAGMRLPDLMLELLPLVTGTVHDEHGATAANCVVQFSGRLRLFPPAVTDAAGRFELKPAFIPLDLKTKLDAPDCFLLAMHPHDSLYGMTAVRIGNAAKSADLDIVLRPGPPEEPVTRPDDLHAAEKPDHPSSGNTLLLGKPAPELDCIAWLNGDRGHYTLDDFHGQYVLIDLWATWCGPCHFDFPKVKWLHESYQGRGLVVIGLHDNSVPIEGIRAHVAHEKINFLVAVDHPDGRTVTRYKSAGMDGYPSYLLIDPQGTVIEMDDVSGRPNLRKRLLSLVRSHVLKGTSPSPPPGDATSELCR